MEDFFPPVVLSRGFKHILSFLLRLLYFERPFPRYLLQFLLSSQFLAYVSPFCKRFSSVTQEEEPSCALPWCFASTVIQCSLGGGIVVHFVFQLDCELCECWDCVSSVSLASLASGSSLLLNKAQISPNWLKGRLINFQTSYWLFKLLSFWVTGVWIPREEINRWWYVLVDWVPLRKKERDYLVWGCWGQFLGGPGSGLGPHRRATLKLAGGTRPAGGENSMSRGHRRGQLWRNSTHLDTWASQLPATPTRAFDNI